MAELNLPTLSIDIEADGSAAIRELNETADAVDRLNGNLDSGRNTRGLDDVAGSARTAGDELRRTGDAAGDAGDRLADAARTARVDWAALGEQMSRLGSTLTVGVTTPIVAALTAGVSGASDLTETLSKTEVVFGEMNQQVLDWASNSVDSMGLAQQTALDMASAYGDLATGMGLDQQAAADMSTSLTQLAADLASFKNMSVEDVKGALSGIFTGETESLKSLGVVMNQTNLEAFALSQGITKSVSSMTQAEQVQLRYAYVMQATSNAQGDFERTGGSLANQMRALGESVKELGTSFGEILMPMITPIVSGIREMIQGFIEMDDGTKRVILAVGMAVAAVGPLLLVGGKIISLITGIKTALASLTLNPVILAITAAVAGVAALAAALNALQPEVDTTSESYNELKDSIIEGAAGKVSLDTSEVPEEVEVSITADGEQALTTAKNIVTELQTDPQYAGKLAIDGDPAKAEEVLADLQSDIAAVEEAVKIGGDSAEAQSALAKLQGDISKLEAVVAYTDDPVTKAALEGKLAQLKTELSTLTASVSFKTENEEGIAAFEEKLAKLPKDESYIATGEFRISDTTLDTVNEYATALAAAAAATGDYATAVENMNEVVDNEAERQKQEVYTQLGETYRTLVGNYNDGILTEEQLQTQIGKATDAAQKQCETIDQQAEAQKKLNEVLSNGSRADDNGATTEIAKKLYGNEHTTTEQGYQALNRLYEKKSQDTATDAARAQAGLMQEQSEKYQQAAAAVQAYQQAMEQANQTQAEGAQVSDSEGNVTRAQEAIERAELMKQAVERYGEVVGALDTQTATDTAVDDLGDALGKYEGLETQIREMLAGENGEGMTYAETFSKTDELDAFVEECQGKIDSATQEADTMRQNAAQTLADTMSGLAEGYTQGSMEAAVDAIEQFTGPLEAAQRELLTTSPNLIEEIGKAAQTGDPAAIQQAIDSAFEGVNIDEAAEGATEGAETAGQNIDQGVVAGMEGSEGEVTSAGESVGEKAVEGVDTGAGTHSPSAKTQETGRNLVAGLAQGMQDTSTVDAAGQTLGEAAVTAVTNAITGSETGSESGRLISDNLATGMADTGAVTTAGQALGDAAVTAVESAFSGNGTGAEQGRQVVQNVAQGMSDTSDIDAAAAGVATAIQGALSGALAGTDGSDEGSTLGAALLSGIAEGAGGNSSGIASALRSAVSSAASAASSGASASGRSIGVNLMSGIRSGISSMVGSIVAAARSAVQQAVAAAKAAGEIHSPSRIMRDQVGVELMRGMETGFEQQAPTTAQKMRESVANVISGAQAVTRANPLGTPALAVAGAAPAIDYERMGEVIGDASTRRPIHFSVGARQLTTVTRDEAARQQAVRVNQINSGYGGK